MEKYQRMIPKNYFSTYVSRESLFADDGHRSVMGLQPGHTGDGVHHQPDCLTARKQQAGGLG